MSVPTVGLDGEKDAKTYCNIARRVHPVAVLCTSLIVLALLPSCNSGDSGKTSATPTATTSATPGATVAAPAPPPGPRPKNWFDLQVGDCVTEIPAIDVGAVTVTVVDCATPHQAEVFFLAPLAVDTAIADVADQKCAQGLVSYAGQPAGGGRYTVTYLIDSNQDRTANNPTPSTAICFLQTADGTPLTESARR